MTLTEWMNQKRGRGLELARALGVMPPTVSDWSTGKKAIPFERCMPIELATGGAVTRRDLKPNDYLKHWPELAETAQPIDIQQNQATALIPPAQVAINTVADTGAAAQAWDGVERRQMTEGV